MLSFPLVAALLPLTLAALQPNAGVIHVPIVRRSQTNGVANLPKVVEALRNKYSDQITVKRDHKREGNAAIPLIDELNDYCYSGVVSIGTPAQTFNIVLDTGSSDFWVATTLCNTCASDISRFDPSNSSTYKPTTGQGSTVDIIYGSGKVHGTIASDTVTFAGFTVTDQKLLAVTGGSTSLLISNGVSGFMGLAFSSLSALETTPFWETLCNTNQLAEPLFSFYLERHVKQPPTDAAPGGILTLGGTNSSLFKGSIEYMSLAGVESYWLLNVHSITVQGKIISVPTSSSLAVIDTATTLIGAPSSMIGNIWSQVPGSVALHGDYYGLYAFPCNTNITISMSFGGTHWKINPVDMNYGNITVLMSGNAVEMCVGAIFDTGSISFGSDMWFVGDTFLKNVYSVFRADPPSVGFAQLASGFSSSTGGAHTTNRNIAIPLTLLATVSVCFTVFL